MTSEPQTDPHSQRRGCTATGIYHTEKMKQENSWETIGDNRERLTWETECINALEKSLEISSSKSERTFHIATNLIIKIFADSRKDFELQLNNVEIIVANNKNASCF